MSKLIPGKGTRTLVLNQPWLATLVGYGFWNVQGTGVWIKWVVEAKKMCVWWDGRRLAKGNSFFPSFKSDTFHYPGDSNFSWQSLSGVANLWMLGHDIVIYRVYAQEWYNLITKINPIRPHHVLSQFMALCQAVHSQGPICPQSAGWPLLVGPCASQDWCPLSSSVHEAWNFFVTSCLLFWVLFLSQV